MARGSSKSTRPKSKVSINFKGVESRTLFPEDDYRVSLKEIRATQSSSGNDQLEFHFVIVAGKFKDKRLPAFYCPLAENSLWKLHGLLTALGIDVPDDEMDLDFEEIVDNANEIMAIVQHDTYEGTKRSKMMDFYPLDDEGAEEEEEEEAPKSSKKAAGKKSKVDDDDDEPADDDDDDEPKSKRGAKGGDDDKAARRKARREARKAKAAGKSSDDDDADDDDEDEKPKGKTSSKRKVADDDDDDEPKSKKSSKKKKDLISADDVLEKDEDELQELIDEHGLDVDLDDYKTLRKKASAVVDALEDAGLLEEE